MKITDETTPKARYTTEENISYTLYEDDAGEGVYIIRDEDADQLVARINGPIEVIALRFEIDVWALI